MASRLGFRGRGVRRSQAARRRLVKIFRAGHLERFRPYSPRGSYEWTYFLSQPRGRVNRGPSHRRGELSDDLREILLTLSSRDFERFARDLKLLREHCAESNTQAILEAVRDRATRVRVAIAENRRAA